jgi:sugar lactone lactonase YvrE
MNKLLVSALLLIAVSFSRAQVITTVAGGNGFGSDSIHLYYPYGVWLDRSGNIYVSDQTAYSDNNLFYGNNSRVQMFPPNSTSSTGGKTVAGGNGPGNAADQLLDPAGIFIDSIGNLYIADPGYDITDVGFTNNRVMKFPPGSTSATNGKVVAGSANSTGPLAFQLTDPLDVFVDDSGYIYVADADNNRIQKFAPGSVSGSSAATVAGGRGYGDNAYQLALPSSVFVDHSGNIYVADYANNRIQKFTPPDTNAVTVAGGNGEGDAANQLNSPTGIFIDNSGNLYVADFYNNRIQMFPPGSDSATNGITVAGGNGYGSDADQLANPSTVYVDTAGNIYIADEDNNRIQKWAPAPAGISPIATATSISIYPNPNKGSFILQSNDLIGQDFTIYDMIGRVIAKGEINTDKQTITLKDISSGSYTLGIMGNKTIRGVVEN